MIETVLIFLIVLGVLIFVHELGHFLVARAFGIRVDEFALGFGPKIFSKKIISAKHGETTYALNAIPFGGYVKIFGETPDEASISGADSSRSFVNKPRYAQALVLFAGVFFNFIFAWLIVAGAFMGGLPVSTEGYSQYSGLFQDEHVVAAQVTPGSPIEKAGIQEGDTILSVEPVETSQAQTPAPHVSQEHQTIDSILSVVHDNPGKPLSVEYISSAFSTATSTLVKIVQITSAQNVIPGDSQTYAIGLGMDTVATLSLPLPQAFSESARYTVMTIGETASGLGGLIVGLFHANRAVLSQVSGPVGIATVVGQAAHAGFTYLLLLVAVISINLGVLNLLPFPALDGGRILFVIIEAIIRRPIKPTVANTVNAVGFGLLMILMLVVTYHDIAKLF